MAWATSSSTSFTSAISKEPWCWFRLPRHGAGVYPHAFPIRERTELNVAAALHGTDRALPEKLLVPAGRPTRGCPFRGQSQRIGFGDRAREEIGLRGPPDW